MYKPKTDENGRKVCMKGWPVAEIQGAVQKRLVGLPNMDSF